MSKLFAICCAASTLMLGVVTGESPGVGTTTEQATQSNAQEPGAVAFNPPAGWRIADPKALPPSVKLMVVGQGSQEFPPSMNLGTENFGGSLKEYLQTIKAINDSQGSEWKDLGTIRTQSGSASLSQVDAKTEWGEVRMMHVIMLKNNVAYILTAAALKDEFPKYYKDFFKSMRSLRFNKDPYEMVADKARRRSLLRSSEKLQLAWEELYSQERNEHPGMSKTTAMEKIFNSKEFQEQYWVPFKEMISENYQDLDTTWQEHLLRQVREEMMSKAKTHSAN